MQFQYKGISRAKQRVSGLLEAQDEAEARVRLRAMQIRPEVVTQVRKNKLVLKSFKFSLGSPVGLKQLIIFTRQLSSLIDSGVSLVQSLDLLAQQEKNKAFKKILLNVKANIEAGGTFAKSIEQYPLVFSDFFVRVIEAGEMSGTLDKSLKSIGLQLDKLAKLKSKVIKALTYPMITLVASIVAVGFLLVKVIPEISKLYGSKKLPDITVFVLKLSQDVQNNFPMILGVVVAVPLVLIGLYRISVVRDFWDPIALKIPLFGTLARRSAVARFSRTLSTLLGSGVPLLAGFDICSKVISNRALQKSIKRSAAGVSEGKSIAEGLSASGEFPPMVIHMINIGEMTGRLDELLAKVAEIYDEEVDNAVDAITSVLQPLLIMFVGVIILFLMVAMYMPIFNLGDNVQF